MRQRSPSTPAFDPYEGEMSPEAPLPGLLYRIGQDNPATREYQRMQNGRYLQGFGEDSPSLAPGGGDPGYDSSEMSEMEEADDTFGSGIFDDPSRATSNVHMGIFASAYSQPGYIAREVPFAVSQDVTDVSDGGGVVYIPAGGYYHIEADGRAVPHPVLGPTPRPPANLPAPLTHIAEPYVNIQDGPERSDLNALAPVRPMPSYQPRRTAWPPIDSVPEDRASNPVPYADPYTSLPRGTVDERFDAGIPVGTGAYMQRRPRRAPSGVGAEGTTASTVGLVVGCAVIGGVIGILASAMTASPARGR